jgi:hypothetical protein
VREVAGYLEVLFVTIGPQALVPLFSVLGAQFIRIKI